MGINCLSTIKVEDHEDFNKPVKIFYVYPFTDYSISGLASVHSHCFGVRPY